MINKKIKFGVMTYPATPKYNVGDYIQSLAAKQYFPKVDVFFEREKLKSYNGEDLNAIMNGWYIHNPNEFPPSEKINPLYISFHLNAKVKDQILNNNEAVKYLKKHEPIGCRDTYTLNALQEKKIKSYFSGCLTTTLNLKYKTSKRTNEIYLADPLFLLPHWGKLMYGKKEFVKGVVTGDIFKFNQRRKLLKNLFTSELLNKAHVVKHKLSGSHSEERRFKEAEDLLNKFASAKMVVTSRIHCALPCLAFNTPVIFLDYGFDKMSDQSRFEGVTDLFNTIKVNGQAKIFANFDLTNDKKIGVDDIYENPTRHLDMAEKLKKTCNNFVEGLQKNDI